MSSILPYAFYVCAHILVVWCWCFTSSLTKMGKVGFAPTKAEGRGIYSPLHLSALRYLPIKKESRTHPTLLGALRRDTPIFHNLSVILFRFETCTTGGRTCISCLIHSRLTTQPHARKSTLPGASVAVSVVPISRYCSNQHIQHHRHLCHA